MIETEDMPIPPEKHEGTHDDCDICDAILEKRNKDMDADNLQENA